MTVNARHVPATSRLQVRARRGLLASLTGIALCGVSLGSTQQTPPANRLPADLLDVVPPSARVTGAPGRMRISQTGCRPVETLTADLRRRIVDVAVQEWAFFGFGVVDQTIVEAPRTFAAPTPAGSRSRRGRSRISTEESARVAASIAGYWTVTAEGGWIIDRQNEAWRRSDGIGARWQSPWSAAFVSWVMCESGLTDTGVFRWAVAHHRYIDQAIHARDGNVRSSVSLKVMPAELDENKGLRPLDFAIPDDALDASPTIRTLSCPGGPGVPSQLQGLIVVAAPTAAGC